MKELQKELLHRNFVDPEEKVYWEEHINGVKVWVGEITHNGRKEIVWFCDNVGVVIPPSQLPLVEQKRYFTLCEQMARKNPDLTHPKVRAFFQIKFSLPWG